MEKFVPKVMELEDRRAPPGGEPPRNIIYNNNISNFKLKKLSKKIKLLINATLLWS